EELQRVDHRRDGDLHAGAFRGAAGGAADLAGFVARLPDQVDRLPVEGDGEAFAARLGGADVRLGARLLEGAEVLLANGEALNDRVFPEGGGDLEVVRE